MAIAPVLGAEGQIQNIPSQQKGCAKKRTGGGKWKGLKRRF